MNAVTCGSGSRARGARTAKAAIEIAVAAAAMRRSRGAAGRVERKTLSGDRAAFDTAAPAGAVVPRGAAFGATGSDGVSTGSTSTRHLDPERTVKLGRDLIPSAVKTLLRG